MHKILILPIAEQDLENIIDYLAQFYEETALDQYDRIIKKIFELRDFPELYEVYSCNSGTMEYRRIVIDKYLVFYVIKNETIEIHRILHGSRDLDNNLL